MVMKLSTKIINIIYFILQAALAAVFILKKQYFNVAGTVFTFIFILLFLLYERKKGTVLTNFIRTCVYITVLSNNFIGEYLNLYHTSAYFDKALHVFGTFSFSIFIFSIANKKGCFIGLKSSFMYVYMLLLGSFIGTMFEIGEFLCDITLKTTNQPSLIDTDLDMVCNTLGAAIAGVFVVCWKHLYSITR